MGFVSETGWIVPSERIQLEKVMAVLYEHCLRRSKDPEISLDVSQEIYLRARGRCFKDNCHFYSWADTVGSNLEHNLRRAKKVRANFEKTISRRRLRLEDFRKWSVRFDYEQVPPLDSEDIDPIFREAISGLPTEQQEILMERLMGRSYAKIAASRGVYPDVIRRRVKNAQQTLLLNEKFKYFLQDSYPSFLKT